MSAPEMYDSVHKVLLVASSAAVLLDRHGLAVLWPGTSKPASALAGRSGLRLLPAAGTMYLVLKALAILRMSDVPQVLLSGVQFALATAAVFAAVSQLVPQCDRPPLHGGLSCTLLRDALVLALPLLAARTLHPHLTRLQEQARRRRDDSGGGPNRQEAQVAAPPRALPPPVVNVADGGGTSAAAAPTESSGGRRRIRYRPPGNRRPYALSIKVRVPPAVPGGGQDRPAPDGFQHVATQLMGEAAAALRAARGTAEGETATGDGGSGGSRGNLDSSGSAGGAPESAGGGIEPAVVGSAAGGGGSAAVLLPTSPSPSGSSGSGGQAAGAARPRMSVGSPMAMVCVEGCAHLLMVVPTSVVPQAEEQERKEEEEEGGSGAARGAAPLAIDAATAEEQEEEGVGSGAAPLAIRHVTIAEASADGGWDPSPVGAAVRVLLAGRGLAETDGAAGDVATGQQVPSPSAFVWPPALPLLDPQLAADGAGGTLQAPLTGDTPPEADPAAARLLLHVLLPESHLARLVSVRCVLAGPGVGGPLHGEQQVVWLDAAVDVAGAASVAEVGGLGSEAGEGNGGEVRYRAIRLELPPQMRALRTAGALTLFVLPLRAADPGPGPEQEHSVTAAAPAPPKAAHAAAGAAAAVDDVAAAPLAAVPLLVLPAAAAAEVLRLYSTALDEAGELTRRLRLRELPAARGTGAGSEAGTGHQRDNLSVGGGRVPPACSNGLRGAGGVRAASRVAATPAPAATGGPAEWAIRLPAAATAAGLTAFAYDLASLLQHAARQEAHAAALPLPGPSPSSAQAPAPAPPPRPGPRPDPRVAAYLLRFLQSRGMPACAQEAMAAGSAAAGAAEGDDPPAHRGTARAARGGDERAERGAAPLKALGVWRQQHAPRLLPTAALLGLLHVALLILRRVSWVG